MSVPVKEFLARVEQIAAEGPRYVRGKDGSSGECDCIGLIIGAIRRAGGQWRGLHGSNYAARHETADLKQIIATSDLSPGEVVYKAYEPGQGGYSLPERYEHGGDFYTGDLRDYMHVGVVISVYPLRIRHMTSPHIKMDTSIGKWKYHGKLKKINYAREDEGPVEKVIIQGGVQTAPIHMRQAASTGSKIILDIVQGTEAELLEGGGAWNLVRVGHRTGYVASEFVHRLEEAETGGEDQGEMISIPKAEAERIYDIIGDWLGLRG